MSTHRKRTFSGAFLLHAVSKAFEFSSEKKEIREQSNNTEKKDMKNKQLLAFFILKCCMFVCSMLIR
jgi:hypothetical protein